MKAWIESSLYHPMLVLPLLMLTQLLVAHDFNLGRVGLIVVVKTVRAVTSHARLPGWVTGQFCTAS